MDTTKLKKFAQFARRTLMGQVSAKLDSVLAPGAAARRASGGDEEARGGHRAGRQMAGD